MSTLCVQIIATIGPASAKKEVLVEMAKGGMTIARLNFSWGTREEHHTYLHAIRAASKEAAIPIRILAALKGPRMQTDSGHTFDKNMPLLTDEDKEMLLFACTEGIDFISVPFIKNAKDIETVRAFITPNAHKPAMIAKIERREAVENLEEILVVADAVLVGRGDLGSAYPLGEIPFIQDEIIATSRTAGKPAIVATEMLLSMIEKDRPTRAEATDIVHALVSGASGIVLSEESAVGKHPTLAVKAMADIAAVACERTGASARTAL